MRFRVHMFAVKKQKVYVFEKTLKAIFWAGTTGIEGDMEAFRVRSFHKIADKFAIATTLGGFTATKGHTATRIFVEERILEDNLEHFLDLHDLAAHFPRLGRADLGTGSAVLAQLKSLLGKTIFQACGMVRAGLHACATAGTEIGKIEELGLIVL